ncbi:ABC transporter permease [Oceanicoccus sagamiensis]|uniref:ABC transporter permease n=2 Tax=Oceanicoccus sagamiensis TaxID=716816 RepID=A0A1X9NLZ6_9GAMM|nr:ABC transporter permease [Oceanicoccus sagamiensis]
MIRQGYLLILMTAATIALFFAALHIGPADINILQALIDNLDNSNTLAAMILSEIRLPRALLAVVVGATLGLAGAAMQGLLRNPLAGPGLVGVSNCAALGAVIALYFGWGTAVWFAVPAAGMVGAAISVVLIFMIGGYKSNVMTLLLAGVAVNAVASSLISLALNFAPNPYAMSEMVYWLLGSLANRSLADVQLATPFMIAGWLLILSSGRFLNALSLGEETAQSLGFHLAKQRTIIVIGVALSVGAAVSVSGNIGFVGLLVPHILRPLVGYEPGRLLAASAFGGALMVLIADIAVQIISPDQELKLGVVTALVGGPFFLYLIIKTRNTLI